MENKKESKITHEKKKTSEEVKVEPVASVQPVQPVQPAQPTVIVQQQKSSSCLPIALAGCGCVGCLGIIIFVGIVIIVVIMGNVAKNSITNSEKNATGVPVFVTNMLEKFVGNTKDGREFINILKNGASEKKNMQYNEPVETPVSEPETQSGE
jgi:hypothetical protein